MLEKENDGLSVSVDANGVISVKFEERPWSAEPDPAVRFKADLFWLEYKLEACDLTSVWKINVVRVLRDGSNNSLVGYVTDGEIEWEWLSIKAQSRR